MNKQHLNIEMAAPAKAAKSAKCAKKAASLIKHHNGVVNIQRYRPVQILVISLTQLATVKLTLYCGEKAW